MQTKHRLMATAFVVALVITILPSLVVDAVPPVACNFWGTVKLNGQNVPDGTVVSVWSDDWSVKWEETPTFTYDGSSTYNININGDDPETGPIEGPTAGETVRFKIGGDDANESSTWQEAGTVQADLTGTGATPTPSHTPTEGPTATNTLTPTLTGTATETPLVTPTYTPTPRPVTKIFRQDELPTADYQGCQDTYVTEWDKDNPHDMDNLRLRVVDVGKIKKPLIKFDLEGQIPVGSTVQQAVLEIKTGYRSREFDLNVEACQLLVDWEETEATWYHSTSGVPWHAPGVEGSGDRLFDPVSTARLSEVEKWVEWTLTDVVQTWVSDPSSNHGVILMPGLVTQTVEWSLYDSEQGHTYLRPKLSVTYLEAPPTPVPTATPSETLTPSPSPTLEHTNTPTATLTPTQGRIFGVVYVDLNRDGELTLGELGVAGAQVELRSATNQLLDSRTTGSGGTYVFDSLYSGSYRVQAIYPAGYYALVPFPPYVAVTVGPGTNRQVNFGCVEQARGASLPLIQKGHWSGVLSQ